MQILFVSLSSRRHRYYRSVQRHSPVGVRARVIHGFVALYALPLLIKTLPSAVTESLKEKVGAQLERQRINYPRLFSSSLISRWYLSCLFGLEKLRFYSLLGAFRRFNPDVIVVWNGQKPPYSTVVAAARHSDIPVWVFENGLFSDTTTLDPAGVNSLSSVHQIPMEWIETNEASRPLGYRKTTGGAFRVLVPLQIESDTQLVLNSSWIKSTDRLVNLVADCLEELTDEVPESEVVVRHHPWAKRRVPVPMRPGVHIDNETTLNDQLKQADVVVTINSSVGLQALALGVPVCALAPSVYSRPEVCPVAVNSEQLREALRTIYRERSPLAGAEPYVKFLSEVYAISGDWHDAPRLPKSHYQSVWSRLLSTDKYAGLLARSRPQGIYRRHQE